MLEHVSAVEPTISVVIPVYKGSGHFEKCLSSLSETAPSPHEIIVVADGDGDGSWVLAERFGAKVLRLPARRGPSVARNLGGQVAQGDVLFFLDADVAVHPDALGRIASTFRREPDLAAIFGSYDDSPAAANFLSQYKNLFHHYVHQTACEEASTFWGACGAIQRKVFLALGGFDEGYRRPSIEDIELGHRLKQAGYRIRLCKELQVKHLKRWRALSLVKSDLLRRGIPWTELILRDRIFIRDLNLRLSSRLSVVLIYGLLVTWVTARWWTPSLIVAGFFGLCLLLLNLPVYRFFQRKRGLWFSVRTVPWHWLYYFLSGMAFAIGTIRHLASRYLRST